MTLIELVRTMCRRLGFSEPNGVIGSNDKNIRQIHALLVQLGTDLVVVHDWRRLQREHLLITRAVQMPAQVTKGSRTVTVNDASLLNDKWIAQGEGMPPFNQINTRVNNSTVQMREPATKTGTVNLTFTQFAYDLPNDWHRQIPQTEYENGPVDGPKTPQFWQAYKSGVIYAGSMFRLIGNTFQVMPPPPNGLVFSFEYMSKNWVASSSIMKPAPTEDSDEFIFSDSLLMTGLVARWFDVHGLDSTIEKRDFAGLLNMAKAQDKSSPLLRISRKPTRTMNIPEGNWNV